LLRNLTERVGTFAVSASKDVVVLIEARTFFRDCMLAALRAAEPKLVIEAFESVSAWSAWDGAASTRLVLIWMAVDARASEADTFYQEQVRQLGQLAEPVPFAVMADAENGQCALQAMQAGARGYMPATMSLETTITALALISVGGSYFPPSMLAASAAAQQASHGPTAEELQAAFTPRQLEVLRLLRAGQPNKLIAYKLGMCESTVKVHVRNMMRRLRAKNRTELGYLAEALASEPAAAV
jgi:DNA-binding NarL/FixJ family response regulator